MYHINMYMRMNLCICVRARKIIEKYSNTPLLLHLYYTTVIIHSITLTFIITSVILY